MSGNGPRRLPSPVRPLLSLLGFDSEAERGAFVAELRRKVVPRSLSLATLGAASVMVTEMAHPGTIPLLLPRPSCLGDWQDDSHMSLYGVGWVLQFLGAVALVAFYEREMTRETCREPRARLRRAWVQLIEVEAMRGCPCRARYGAPPELGGGKCRSRSDIYGIYVKSHTIGQGGRDGSDSDDSRGCAQSTPGSR